MNGYNSPNNQNMISQQQNIPMSYDRQMQSSRIQPQLVQNMQPNNSASSGMLVSVRNKHHLNDDDRRKIRTIEQCLLSCISAFSIPDRLAHSLYKPNGSTKAQREMLIKIALQNVLKKQKTDGLGSVSASRTAVNNARQMLNVGSAMAYKGYSSVFSRKQPQSQGGKMKKTKTMKKMKKTKKTRKSLKKN